MERLAAATALLVAAIFAFLIPLTWYAVNVANAEDYLQDQASISAGVVSELVYSDPDLWMFQEYRLHDILAHSRTSSKKYHLALYASDPEAIVTIGDKFDSMYLRAQAPLNDGRTRVGRIEVATSYRPLIVSTLWVSVFGALFGAGIYYLLKYMPFKALRLAMEQRNQALREANNRALELHHLAMHDTLTGLPNRTFFLERFRQILAGDRNDAPLYLLIADLDRFKEINDALGHHIGDELLKAIARRIASKLGDSAFLARLGGDEFALLVFGHDTSGETVANQVTESLKGHLELEGYHIEVNASIGIACFPSDADNVSELMQCADTAMYHAKTRGKPFHVYDGLMTNPDLGHLSLAAELRHALDAGALSLNYQPQVCCHTGQIVGVEALARWPHEEHGFVSPQLFVSIAEQSHVINDLTAWVVDTALSQLEDWHQDGIAIRMSINISAKNLQDDAFVDTVLDLVRERKIEPAFVTLELTESSIIIDPDKAEMRIREFAKAGLRISIDDYGTGYSSLAYLKRLTVDELKIDKSFILNMEEDEEDRTIVRSTIELAHSLGMSVVAEGVENQAAADLLHSFGCETGQGYYYNRPLPSDELTPLLHQKAAQKALSFTA